MRKFERIRVDKGEAFIRDTGITVLDVVPQILAGKTTSELLEKYPNLEVEDIVESLAYSICDIAEMTAMARSDGISPIASIINAMTILTDENAPLQATDRNKVMNMILPAARGTLNVWDKFSEWIHIKYLHQLYPSNPRPITFPEILKELESARTHYNFKGETHYNAPDNLPAIKSNGYLVIAFSEILFDKTLRLESGGQVTLEKLDENKISVEIIKKFKSPPYTPDYFRPLLSFWGYFSNFLLIVREHGSEAQITPTDKNLIITFTIPIWHENT